MNGVRLESESHQHVMEQQRLVRLMEPALRQAGDVRGRHEGGHTHDETCAHRMLALQASVNQRGTRAPEQCCA